MSWAATPAGQRPPERPSKSTCGAGGLRLIALFGTLEYDEDYDVRKARGCPDEVPGADMEV